MKSEADNRLDMAELDARVDELMDGAGEWWLEEKAKSDIEDSPYESYWEEQWEKCDEV